jgi:hypothetical protein
MSSVTENVHFRTMADIRWSEKHAVARFSSVILPGQSQLISVPFAIGEQQQVLHIRRVGGRVEIMRACPWRIRKLRRDRHLEQTAAMVPPSVVIKDCMGGRRFARSLLPLSDW